MSPDSNESALSGADADRIGGDTIYGDRTYPFASLTRWDDRDTAMLLSET